VPESIAARTPSRPTSAACTADERRMHGRRAPRARPTSAAGTAAETCIAGPPRPLAQHAATASSGAATTVARRLGSRTRRRGALEHVDRHRRCRRPRASSRAASIVGGARSVGALCTPTLLGCERWPLSCGSLSCWIASCPPTGWFAPNEPALMSSRPSSHQTPLVTPRISASLAATRGTRVYDYVWTDRFQTSIFYIRSALSDSHSLTLSLSHSLTL
jgi:hypothetical protein